MWTMIATWCMALEGIQQGSETLKKGGSASDAVEIAARAVEDNPWFKSVGFGGLPNEEMDVELDAGFMDGTTLGVGAVASIHDFANPISIARKLTNLETNCVLAGYGAERYASKEGFERKNMLTPRAKKLYFEKIEETRQTQNPYMGHDTVGVSAIDNNGHIAAGTTTSGLFLKKPGRVGDSPIVGSGFYADSEVGSANATGLGEDLMKGCVSYEIVRRMRDGETPQEACEHTVAELDERLKRCRGRSGDLSVIAIDKNGNWGAATNINGFSFVVASENTEPVVYTANYENGHTVFQPASKEWMAEYTRTHSAQVEETD